MDLRPKPPRWWCVFRRRFMARPESACRLSNPRKTGRGCLFPGWPMNKPARPGKPRTNQPPEKRLSANAPLRLRQFSFSFLGVAVRSTANFTNLDRRFEFLQRFSFLIEEREDAAHGLVRSRKQGTIGFRRGRLDRKAIVGQGPVQSLRLQIVVGRVPRPETGGLAQSKKQAGASRAFPRHSFQPNLFLPQNFHLGAFFRLRKS